MSDCIFCKIVSKEIPATVVFENEEMMAFKDINPQGPVHVQFISKKHIPNLNEASEEDFGLMGRILRQIALYARQEGFSESGYRVVNNVGPEGGQEVYHLHFHLIAGRQLQWPPG